MAVAADDVDPASRGTQQGSLSRICMRSRNSFASNAIRGGLAGAVATIGMTAAMVWMHRRLSIRQRYGLPPEQIVDELLERADAEGELSQEQFKSLTMVVHHGYGTAMGSAYGILSPHLRSSPIAGGVCFGFAVWAVGYLGWLPALRMDASAMREPCQRNAMTIASHLVWGAITGWLIKAAEESAVRRQMRGESPSRFPRGPRVPSSRFASTCPPVSPIRLRSQG